MGLLSNADDIDVSHINNINQILARNQQSFPESLGYRFISDNKQATLTYSQLAFEVHKLSALISEYAKEGDRIIIGARPGLEFIISFYACLQSGCIAVPLFPPVNSLLASRFATVTESAQPTAVICDRKTAAKIKQGIFASQFFPRYIKEALGLKEPMVNLFQLIKSKGIQLLSSEDRATVSLSTTQPYPSKSDDIAFLQYTSGATGHPKGVMISHGNLLDNLSIMKRVLNHRPESHIFSWLPPYHDMGLIAPILAPLYAVFPSTMISTIDFIYNPESWMKYMSDFQCTVTGAPNFAFELSTRKTSDELVQQLDLSRVEAIANGAEPINVATINRFYKKFAPAGLRKGAVFPCYGLAESTVMASAPPLLKEEKIIHVDTEKLSRKKVVLNDSDNSTSLVSSGVVQMETLIVDDTKLTECEANEVGEIWIRGDSVAKGYYNDPDNTEATFHAYLKGHKTPYLRTGDLGFIYQGELFVCGRIKDMIIIRGENYFPQDIELLLADSIKQLRKGCIIACSVNQNGEERLALIAELKKPLKTFEYEATCHKIQAAVSSYFNLHVSDIYLIPAKKIPKTSSGKLQRAKCKQAIETHSLESLYSWHSEADSLDLTATLTLPAVDERWWQKFNTASSENKQDMLASWLKTALSIVLKSKPNALKSNDTSFFELGLDSIRLYEFKQLIDQGFASRLSIDAKDLFKYDTVKTLSMWMISQFAEVNDARGVKQTRLEPVYLEQRLEKIPQVIKKWLGISILEDVIKQYEETPPVSQRHIYEKFLQAFEIQYAIKQSVDLADIHNKPLIIVANHPSGLNDSIIVPHLLLNQCRFKEPIITLVNQMTLLKPFKPYLIPVDVYEDSHINVVALEQALNHLKENHPVLIFPSAEIGSYDNHQQRVIDPAWSDSVLMLRNKSNAYVLPIFIDYKPSKWGWLFDHLPFSVRKYLFLRHAMSTAGQPCSVSLKKPIPPTQFMSIEQLRNICNELGRVIN